MRLPTTRPALALLAFSLLGPVVALGPGCGAPPAKDPPPPAASEDRPKQDATGLTGTPLTMKDPAATSATSAPTSAPASSGSAASVKGNDRLEDKTFSKAGSAGGQYSVIVLSAAGLDAIEVGVALGNTSPRSDACYSAFFKKPLGAPGSTVFDVTTSGKGKTQSVKLKSDDFKDAELVKCLDGVIKGVHWPTTKEKGGGKTSIEWRAKGN